MPTLVQTKQGDVTSGSTLTITLGSASTSGNLLLCAFNAYKATVSSVVDSAGNNWTQDWYQVHTSPNVYGYHLPTASNTGGITSVTITVSAAGAIAGSVDEWSGVTSTEDGTPPSANGYSTAPSSGSLTTANASDLLWGAIGADVGTVSAVGTGWTSEGNVTTFNVNVTVCYQVVSATGTYSLSGTLSATDDWGCGFVAFEASGTGPVQHTFSTSFAGTGHLALLRQTEADLSFAAASGLALVKRAALSLVAAATSTLALAKRVSLPRPSGATAGLSAQRQVDSSIALPSTGSLGEGPRQIAVSRAASAVSHLALVKDGAVRLALTALSGLRWSYQNVFLLSLTFAAQSGLSLVRRVSIVRRSGGLAQLGLRKGVATSVSARGVAGFSAVALPLSHVYYLALSFAAISGLTARRSVGKLVRVAGQVGLDLRRRTAATILFAARGNLGVVKRVGIALSIGARSLLGLILQTIRPGAKPSVTLYAQQRVLSVASPARSLVSLAQPRLLALSASQRDLVVAAQLRVLTVEAD